MKTTNKKQNKIKEKNKMTNETNQEEREWKAQRATENIWKIQDVLDAELRYITTMYDVFSNGHIQSKTYAEQVKPYVPLNHGATWSLIKNSKETFGTIDNTITDVENRVYCNTEHYPKDESCISGIRIEREKHLSPADRTQGIERYSFMKEALERAKATEEECKAIGKRTMSREQFEDVMIRAFENCPSRTPSERLGYSAPDPYIRFVRTAFMELQKTPYIDRATISSQPTSKPYEVQELSPDEWEAKKSEILKPRRKGNEL